jgi:hypothetical protein
LGFCLLRRLRSSTMTLFIDQRFPNFLLTRDFSAGGQTVQKQY